MVRYKEMKKNGIRSMVCVFLWSNGFLAQRVFDKVIFYLNSLSSQQVSVQKLSAGA